MLTTRLTNVFIVYTGPRNMVICRGNYEFRLNRSSLPPLSLLMSHAKHLTESDRAIRHSILSRGHGALLEGTMTVLRGSYCRLRIPTHLHQYSITLRKADSYNPLQKASKYRSHRGDPDLVDMGTKPNTKSKLTLDLNIVGEYNRKNSRHCNCQRVISSFAIAYSG